MNIIRAQFMHQHKDKVVYEREIFLDTPTLSQCYNELTVCFEFDMPLFIGAEPEFIIRWLKSNQNCRVTRRPLRLIGSNGTILCALPKRPFKANIRIPENFDRNIPTVHICCIVENDDIKELNKIFFPKYFAD